jgi:hypothetical protein
LALALLAAKPVQVKHKVPIGAVAMHVHGWKHQEKPVYQMFVVHNLIGFLTYLAGYEPDDLFDGEKAVFTFKTEDFDPPAVMPGYPIVVEPFELRVYYNASGNPYTMLPCNSADLYEDGQHIATFRTTPARILKGEGIIFSAELTYSSPFSFQGKTCNFQSLFPGLTFSLSYTTEPWSVTQCLKNAGEPEFTIFELDGSAWAVGLPGSL